MGKKPISDRSGDINKRLRQRRDDRQATLRDRIKKLTERFFADNVAAKALSPSNKRNVIATMNKIPPETGIPPIRKKEISYWNYMTQVPEIQNVNHMIERLLRFLVTWPIEHNEKNPEEWPDFPTSIESFDFIKEGEIRATTTERRKERERQERHKRQRDEEQPPPIAPDSYVQVQRSSEPAIDNEDENDDTTELSKWLQSNEVGFVDVDSSKIRSLDEVAVLVNKSVVTFVKPLTPPFIWMEDPQRTVEFIEPGTIEKLMKSSYRGFDVTSKNKSYATQRQMLDRSIQLYIFSMLCRATQFNNFNAIETWSSFFESRDDDYIGQFYVFRSASETNNNKSILEFNEWLPLVSKAYNNFVLLFGNALSYVVMSTGKDVNTGRKNNDIHNLIIEWLQVIVDLWKSKSDIEMMTRDEEFINVLWAHTKKVVRGALPKIKSRSGLM